MIRNALENLLDWLAKTNAKRRFMDGNTVKDIKFEVSKRREKEHLKPLKGSDLREKLRSL